MPTTTRPRERTRRLGGPPPDDVPRVPGLTLLRPVGGDGPPWRARDTTSGQEVVVRPMPPRGEAGRLAALPDHPHLAVPGVRADAAGRPLLVSAAAPHGDLVALLRRRRALTPPEVSMLAVTLARALAAVHARGLVHGAVGPEGVLLGAEARPSLDASVMAAPPRPGAAAADDVRDLGRLLVAAAGDDLPMALRVLVSAAVDPSPALRPLAVDVVREAMTAVPPAPLRLRSDEPDEGPPEPRGRAERRLRAARAGRRAPRLAARAGAWLAAAVRPGRGPGRLVGVTAAGAAGLAALVAVLFLAHGHERVAAASPPPPAGVDWAVVLDGLDRAREAAFTSADPARLAGVDLPGSSADAADRSAVARLATAGVRARGLRDVVRSVRVVDASVDRTVLDVRDERSAYDLVDATGTAVGHQPSRGVADWQVVLRRTPAGWRVSDVARRDRRVHTRVATASSRVGCCQWNPATPSTAGTTRIEASTSDENPPSTVRSANAGAGSSAGRCSRAPMAWAISRCVTGSGAVTLTGPEMSCSSRKVVAATMSARVTKLHHCRPSPSGPPSPSRKSGSIRLQAPPSLDITRPVRVWTTRMPASRAGSAARSQATTTSEAKGRGPSATPRRRRVRRCRRRSRWPTARRGPRAGGPGTPWLRRGGRPVDPGARISRLVRLGPAVVPEAGSRQVHDAVDPGEPGRSTVPRRRVPRHLVGCARRAPDQPQDVVTLASQVSGPGPYRGSRTTPVTTTFTRPSSPGPGTPRHSCGRAVQPPSSPSKAPVLEALLHRGQEARRVRTVDQPVVVGEGEVGHRTDRDGVGPVASRDDDRALHHGASAEDGRPAAG